MPRKKAGAGGQAQVKWSRSMRLAVYIIHAEHKLARHDRTAVFNRIFSDELTTCGLPLGASANIIAAQWHERKKSNADWVAICRSGPGAVDARTREDMRTQVQQAIESDKGDIALGRNVGENITLAKTPTAARPVGAPATPRGQGSGRKPHAVPSASTNTQTPITDAFMSTTLQGGTAAVGAGGTPPSATFREALSRAAYTPPITPPPSRRPVAPAVHRQKRSFAEVSDSDEYSPSSKRNAARKSNAVIVVPRTPRANGACELKTPTKSPRRLRVCPPKAAFHRPDGSSIMVREDQIGDIRSEVQPVPSSKAHPPLPGLLFRCWEKDSSCDRNSEHGFWARKYYRSNVVPHIPPPSIHIDPTDMFNHFDRRMDKTPFISTSNRFIWMVQLMIKNMKAGNGSWRVSVIDTSALDRRAVFYARPFHDEVIKTRGFSNGAQRYRGTFEFWVWKQIPQKAIITTFRPQDLIDLANTNQAIGNALQMEVLCAPRGSLSRTKIPMLQSNNVALSPEITVGIAQLGRFLGLDAHSPVEHLSHVVSDVVEGWALAVERREEEEWYQMAGVFARKLCRLSRQPVSFKQREIVKFAFLNGVAWGCGEVNASYKPHLIAKKQKKASSAGLASPARICANALDAARLTIMAHEKAHYHRLNEYHRQCLLPGGPLKLGPDDADSDMDDLDVDTPMNGAAIGRRQIEGIESADDASDDDDDEIMFIDHELGL